ncbi:hypothetical protein K4L06_01425 [Lysobacter sp. BMK333-48F3]|uniref:hypothetical protein n=1 Tax=Lysobacter sp. BMK333-48F3 TaxID=2867962 RepID=UPI001C8C1125|nr:hypothetical protein [Lysobacter sp. BMK333-48F3]MBX9399955.1 hypothetical protein [Lysobacter sp. BMK333-48F3]
MTETSMPTIPPAAAAAVRAGHTIEAIKLVREANPGMRLAEAKEAVEAYIEAGGWNAAPAAAEPASAPRTTGGLPDDAVSLLRSGRRLEAVKRVREALGLGLRDALSKVEAFEAEEDKAFVSGRAPVMAAVPGDVAMALLRGDREGALELLQNRHGLEPMEALRQVLLHERQRIGRGGGRQQATVAAGDGGGRWLVWAALAALLAGGAWYVLA